MKLHMAGRRHVRSERGFTLIELLVVVAIVALLVSILLPSLSRARGQAKLVVCQSNSRQLLMAFMTYTVESKGRLPGAGYDRNLDWLGRYNDGGRQPQDGKIYKYLGNQTAVYMCPDAPMQTGDQFPYSYSFNTMMSGAALERVLGAHYRFSGNVNDLKNYSEVDHRVSATTQSMRYIPAPVLVEEEWEYSLKGVSNGAWDNEDGISMRHLSKWGTIAWHDGSMGRLSLPTTPRTQGRYFTAKAHCIRVKRGWISARKTSDTNALKKDGAYGILDRWPDASNHGVYH